MAKKAFPKKQLLSVTKRENDYTLAIEKIAHANDILIVFPMSYTGDALAASVALSECLKQVGKNITIATPKAEVYGHQWISENAAIQESLTNVGEFLIRIQSNNVIIERVEYAANDDGVDIILSPKGGVLQPEDVSFPLDGSNFDLIITVSILDKKDLGQLWTDYPSVWANAQMLHLTAGDAPSKVRGKKLHDANACSVSEVVWSLILNEKTLKEACTTEMQTALLAGIIGATGSFLEGYTTPNAFLTAAKLMQEDADHTHVINKIYKEKPLQVLQLWGAILRSLQLDRIHKFTWGRLTTSDLIDANAQKANLKGLSDNLLRHVEDSELSVLLIEEGANVRVELRSSNQADLFEGLKYDSGYTATPVPHGVDLFIPKQTLATVEMELLQDLVAFQKARHDIPSDIPITRANIITEAQNTAQTKVPEKTARPKKDWEKANVPFIVPTKDAGNS